MARLTTQDEKTLTQLYGEGHTYKEIAARMGSSPQTVSRHARRMGLPSMNPDTSLTQTGPSRLAAPSMQQRRTVVCDMLLTKAVEMLESIDKPYTAFAFGGKDFNYVEHEVDPVPRDKADLARAAVLLLDEHRKLTEFDAEDGAAASRSVLGALVHAIGIAAVELEGGRVVGEILAGTAEDV